MNVRMPDGTTITNVPEGTTKAQLLEKYQRYTAAPKQTGTTLTDVAGAAIEPNLALLSGTVAQPVAGLVGLANVIGKPLGLTSADPAQRVREVQSALTYAPRTEAGKRAMEFIGYPFEKLAQGAGYAGKKVLEKTGSPLAASTVDTALQASPLLLGGKLTLSAPSTTLKHLESLREGMKDVAAIATKGGEERIVGKGLQAAIGPEHLPKVIQKLESAKELVPGSKPTVAEAVAGEPGGSPLQAYQKVASETKGGPSAKFGERLREQQQARESVLKRIASETESPEAAIKSRSAASALNYSPAFKQVSKVDPDLRQILLRPSMQKAMKVADQLAQESGIVYPKSKGAVAIQKLHHAKLALDDMIKNPERFGLGKTEEASISSTKDALVKWIEANSKPYQFARSEHQRLSVPVNRAQVREALEKKLTAPTGQESPGAFLRAVEESPSMLKKATGYPRYSKLEDVLSPQEAAGVRTVAADLERALAAKRPLQPTSIGGSIQANEATAHLLPNILARPITGTKWLAEILAERMQPKMDVYGANAMLDPMQTARMLRGRYTQPMSPYMKQLADRMAALAMVQSLSQQPR